MRWPHCGIPFVYRRTRIVDVVWVNFTSEVANCIEECQKIESLKLRKAVKETLIRRLPMMTYNMQRTWISTGYRFKFCNPSVGTPN